MRDTIGGNPAAERRPIPSRPPQGRRPLSAGDAERPQEGRRRGR